MSSSQLRLTNGESPSTIGTPDILTASWKDERHLHRDEHIEQCVRTHLVHFRSRHIKNGTVTDSKWHGRWRLSDGVDGPNTVMTINFHFNGDNAKYLHTVHLVKLSDDLWSGVSHPVQMFAKGHIFTSGTFVPLIPCRSVPL